MRKLVRGLTKFKEGDRVTYGLLGQAAPRYAVGTVVKWKDHNRRTVGAGLYPPNVCEDDVLVVQWPVDPRGLSIMGPFMLDHQTVLVEKAPDKPPSLLDRLQIDGRSPLVAPAVVLPIPAAAPGYKAIPIAQLKPDQPRWFCMRAAPLARPPAMRDLHLHKFGQFGSADELKWYALVADTETKKRKPVVYVAHPVTGAPLANCIKVIEWIGYLTHADPARVYVAPWVPEVLAFAGEKCAPEFYDRVLADDCEVLSRFDAILMVGGRISEGMRREMRAAKAAGKLVIDCSNLASVEAARKAELDLPGLIGGQL